MTEAKTGWGGEFHLASTAGGTPTELVEVVSFTLPNETKETTEATHLKSPGRRREYITTMFDGGELSVVLNYIPGSPTDILLAAAFENPDALPFMAVVPRKTTDWEIEGFAIVTGRDRGEVSADGKMEITVGLQLTGQNSEGAAS